jgi:hypothetical protein
VAHIGALTSFARGEEHLYSIIHHHLSEASQVGALVCRLFGYKGGWPILVVLGKAVHHDGDGEGQDEDPRESAQAT